MAEKRATRRCCTNGRAKTSMRDVSILSKEFWIRSEEDKAYCGLSLMFIATAAVILLHWAVVA